MNQPLLGKIAVVTGASRGIGKGIAVEPGAAGATVYLTARTEVTGPIPGTIGETAAEIESLGGRAIAVRVDHHEDDGVVALFERIEREAGRVDVLVNNAFSAPDLRPWLGKHFWEVPIGMWDEIVGVGARSHYVAAALATPLMLRGDGSGSLIANVSSSGATQYAHNVLYGVGKAAVDKMTADMAFELRDHGVAVVSIWPGLVRTEMIVHGAPKDEHGHPYLELHGARFDLMNAETPRFVGRGVAALAADPQRMDRTGTALTTGELAQIYAFTDVDGRMPGVQIRP